jgi:prepilin-type N-terminal cleavage/methylation domain-containing protein
METPATAERLLIRIGMKTESRGFTLLEMMVVAGIGMIITVTAVPNMITGISNLRLRSSMTSLAGVIQNCRMLSVKLNQAMTTHFSPQTEGVIVFVKKSTDSSGYTVNDSQVELQAPVLQVPMAPSGPNAPSAIDPTVLGFTPLNSDPSFNSTGLPCAYASGLCPNSGFIYYFHDLRPEGKQGWAALSISPAGRLKKWFWNGTIWTD